MSCRRDPSPRLLSPSRRPPRRCCSSVVAGPAPTTLRGAGPEVRIADRGHHGCGDHRSNPGHGGENVARCGTIAGGLDGGGRAPPSSSDRAGGQSSSPAARARVWMRRSSTSATTAKTQRPICRRGNSARWLRKALIVAVRGFRRTVDPAHTSIAVLLVEQLYGRGAAPPRSRPRHRPHRLVGLDVGPNAAAGASAAPRRSRAWPSSRAQSGPRRRGPSRPTTQAGKVAKNSRTLPRANLRLSSTCPWASAPCTERASPRCYARHFGGHRRHRRRARHRWSRPHRAPAHSERRHSARHQRLAPGTLGAPSPLPGAPHHTQIRGGRDRSCPPTGKNGPGTSARPYAAAGDGRGGGREITSPM